MRVRRLTGSRNGCPPHARACPSLARGGVTTRPATSRRQTLRRSGPLQAEGPQIFPSARPRPSTPLGPPPILPSVPARHGPDRPPAGTTDAGIRGPTLGVAGASDDIDDRGTIVRDAPPCRDHPRPFGRCRRAPRSVRRRIGNRARSGQSRLSPPGPWTAWPRQHPRPQAVSGLSAMHPRRCYAQDHLPGSVVRPRRSRARAHRARPFGALIAERPPGDRSAIRHPWCDRKLRRAPP
jgi:hypothetical protein